MSTTGIYARLSHIFSGPNTPVEQTVFPPCSGGHRYDKFLVPPIYLAIEKENWAEAQELLKKGADPNALEEFAGTFDYELRSEEWTNREKGPIKNKNPLRSICSRLSQRSRPMLLKDKFQFFQTVRALLEAGARIDQVSLKTALAHPRFPLDNNEVCTRWQNDVQELITILLEANAHPDSKGSKAWALLPNAIQHNHLQTVKALLDNNTDPNQTGPKNESALGAAFLNECLEIIDLLLDRGANFNMQTLISFFIAATNSNKPQAIINLFLHPKIQTPDFAFYFAPDKKMDIRDWLLIWAAENHHEELARLLLVKGADLSIAKDYVDYFIGPNKQPVKSVKQTRFFLHSLHQSELP